MSGGHQTAPGKKYDRRDGMTCEQIGKLMGLSASRVQQIEMVALRKLRRTSPELERLLRDQEERRNQATHQILATPPSEIQEGTLPVSVPQMRGGKRK